MFKIPASGKCVCAPLNVSYVAHLATTKPGWCNATCRATLAVHRTMSTQHWASLLCYLIHWQHHSVTHYWNCLMRGCTPSLFVHGKQQVMQPLVEAGNTKTSNLFTALLAQTFFTVTTVEHEYLYYQCKEKYEHKNPCQASTGHPFLATSRASVFKTEVNLESHSWSPRCKHLNFVLNWPQHKF